MGYYTEISNNKDLAAKDVALYNRMNGVSAHNSGTAAVLAQAVPSIFMSLTTKIAERQSAKENNETESTSEDAERTRLQKELSKALKDIGAESEKDINTAVTTATNKRNTAVSNANNELNTLKTEVAGKNYQYSSPEDYDKAIQTETANLSNVTDETAKTEIQTKINKLKEEKANFENDQKRIADAEKNLQKVTETEDAKLAKITQRALEAGELVNQLAALNSVDNKETEKVEAQYNELKTFTDAYKNYKNAPSKETALALQKVYQDCPQDSPNYNNISTLYKMYQKDVEGLL